MTNIIEYFSADQVGGPDLGWLIQNEQVTDSELCGILMDNYAPKLSWLAFLLTRTPIEMADVINQTLIQAIYNRKNYPGDVPGKIWLWGLAIKECLRVRRYNVSRKSGYDLALLKVFAPDAYFDGHTSEIYHCLGKKNCLLMFLHFGFNLSAEEIAYLLALPVDRVQTDLGAIRGNLAEHQAACPTCQVQQSGIMDAVVLLVRAIETNKPEMEYNQPTRARWHETILDQAASLHRLTHVRARSFQLIEVGGLLVVLFLSLWLVIHQPGKPLPPLMLTTPTAPVVRKAATKAPIARVNPTRTPAVSNTLVPPPPPSISSILGRVNSSMRSWKSIWADVEVIRYDPSGSTDGQLLTRKQVWLSQPFSSRVITGPVDGEPAQTIAILNNRYISQDFQNGQTVRSFSADLLTDTDLQALLIPQYMLPAEGSFQYSGSDRISGRPVWILDHYDGTILTDTIAVDMDYGIILYRREYGGKDRKTVLQDTRVNSIAYNPLVSASIFAADMYLGDHYAIDFSGTPDIYNVQNALAVWTSPTSFSLLGQQPTPIPLNPSTSELTFLNPANIEASTGQDLFANGHYLGQLPVGGSAIMTCERSPDGSKIAYNSEGVGAMGDTALYVANLSSIQTTYRVLPDGFTAGDYAFSPDGKRLSFFGCSKANGFCGLMILDTDTGKVSQVASLKYADYMSWKPDGNYLALVGVEDNSLALKKINNQNLLLNEVIAINEIWHYYVFDASNGSIVFQQPFEWSLLSAPSDSPTNSWNVPLKNQPGGIDGCTNPPSLK